MMFKHDIFLCHTSTDKDWVRKLGEKIESEKCGDRHLKVFFDEWDIQPGQNIVKELENGLAESRYVGVVLSKQMLEADWPTMECTIAVSNDPSGRKGTVIPIWLGNCEIPASLKIRHVLYCNNELAYKRSYNKLIMLLKNQNNSRKLQSDKIEHDNMNDVHWEIQCADEIEEQIVSNLLPVTLLPKYIWGGPVSSSTKYADIFRHLKKNTKGVRPTFLLKEKIIYTFWDLNNNLCPFRKLLVADSIRQIEISTWKNDHDKRNGLMELLNRALRSNCHDLNLRYDTRTKKYFFGPYGGQDRIIEWNTGMRKASRAVVKKHLRTNKKEFWAHQSIKAKFENIDGEIFLKLVPSWMFTLDGEKSIPTREIGSLSTKWIHNQYNSSVFYHIRFWCNILSEGKPKIFLKLGNTNAEIDVTPATSEIKVGIYGDQFTIRKIFDVAENEVVNNHDFKKEEMIQNE